MKAVYREVLADLDKRIERLRGTRAAIASIAEADDTRVEDVRAPRRRGRGKTGRAKVGGGDQVVLAAVKGGADTVKKIAAEAMVKQFTARAALRRLLNAKKVRREGATRNLRYLAS